MRRFILTILAIGTLSAPVFAQQSVVAKYRSQYPTPMAKDQILALERSVASEVHGGLLRKPDGNSCGGYACDIICFSDAQLFDILGDSEGAATPSWNPTTNPRGYHCELVTPAPADPPPTHTEDDELLRQQLAELAPRLSALEQRIVAQEQRVLALEHRTPTSTTPPPPATSDLAADVQRIRELFELAAKRFGLQ